MKFKEGDNLYYINPYIFFIDFVKIEIGLIEEEELFYITNDNAYLREEDLFKDFKEAQREALTRLEKFSNQMRYNILNTKPKLDKEIS